MKRIQSFSSSPGTTGLKYYTHFFSKYNLDYSYHPLQVIDLKKQIELAIKDGIMAFSVSMPFKRSIIEYLDISDQLVSKFKSCNTVLIQNNKLIGHNADYYGALAISKLIPQSSDVIILGNGCMGNMFNKILPNSRLISRSLDNWKDRYNESNVVINCTALGTMIKDSPFTQLPKTKLIIDLALKDNDLKKQCVEQNVKYVSGIEFYKHNFLKQFEIYTGQKIDANEFEEV